MFKLSNYSSFQNSNNNCELVPGFEVQWICFKLHKDTNINNITIYRNEVEKQLKDVLFIKLNSRPLNPNFSKEIKYRRITLDNNNNNSHNDFILSAGVYCFTSKTLNEWFNGRTQKPSFKLVVKDCPQCEYFLKHVSCGKKKQNKPILQQEFVSQNIPLNTQQQIVTTACQLDNQQQQSPLTSESMDELLNFDSQM